MMKRRGSARVAEPPSPIPQMDGGHKQTPNKPNQQTPTKPTPKQKSLPVRNGILPGALPV